MELNDSNVGNIKELIDNVIENPSFTEGREKARQDTWAHIGESAKRSADFIMKKYHDAVNAEEKQKAKAKNNSKSKSNRKISIAKGNS